MSTNEKKESMDVDKKEEIETTEKKENKLIVISGITSGIGAGMLREFTSMGYTVAGFGRRKELIDALVKELNIDNSNELLVNLDICDFELLSKWSEKIISNYGAPKFLIHNAGSLIGCNKCVWEIDTKLLLQSWLIHVNGSVNLIKSFVPSMRSKNEGIIINITSWAGKVGYAEGSPYVQSKFALEGLTQCLAKELADYNPNMAAICVSPGFVNTDMLKGSFSETAAKQQNVENGDEWAKKCCKWLLSLNSTQNGKSLGPPLEKESMKKYCDFFKIYGVEMDYKQFIHPTE